MHDSNNSKDFQPIIIVAPNGARKTKDDLPQIPLSAEEIGAEAKICADSGTAMIHLHVRDENQRHSLDGDLYKRAIEQVREQAGEEIVIQITTEAVGIYEPKQQIQAVRDVMPEAVSVGLREFIRNRKEDEEKRAADFFHWLESEKIWPQYILYNPEEIEYFMSLRERGLIPQNHDFVLFVLGKKQRVARPDAFAQVEDLKPFVEIHQQVGGGLHWAVCAFGGNENAIMLKAAEQGGSVRIGFENNHLLPNGETAASNAALIDEFVSDYKKEVISAANLRSRVFK